MYEVTMHFTGYKKWSKITESVGGKKKKKAVLQNP